MVPFTLELVNGTEGTDAARMELRVFAEQADG